MEEIREWWSDLVDEIKVLDFRLSLEIDEIRRELGAFAEACREVVERDLLGK